jgi:hypothetical protein
MRKEKKNWNSVMCNFGRDMQQIGRQQAGRQAGR